VGFLTSKERWTNTIRTLHG